MSEIKMEQHGEGSVQIGEISGGENTFIFQAPIDDDAIEASPIEKLNSYLHKAFAKQDKSFSIKPKAQQQKSLSRMNAVLVR